MSSLLSHIGHDFFLDLSSEHTCVVDAVYRECTRMSQETSVIDRHRSSLLHQLDIGCFLDLLMTHPHRHHSDGMISWSGDRGKRLVLHVLLVSRSAECTCTISRISSGVYRMNFSVHWSLWTSHVTSLPLAWFCSGLVIIFGLPLLYANRYLYVNTDDFDVMSILQEGAMPGVCLFLATWIISYTGFHY